MGMALTPPRGVSSAIRPCYIFHTRTFYVAAHGSFTRKGGPSRLFPCASTRSVVTPPGLLLCSVRSTRVSCSKKGSSEGSASEKMSDELIAWLRTEASEQESEEFGMGRRAQMIASVADIEEDPNISDSDEEFELDELVIDEIDDLDLEEDPPPWVVDSFTPLESQTVPERSAVVPSVDQEPAPVTSSGHFQWKGMLWATALLFFLRWIWKAFRKDRAKSQSTAPNPAVPPTSMQQSLESLKSLPFGVQPTPDCEPVEWVNTCWRKAWRVYQRGLERWLSRLLQPLFDNVVGTGKVPTFVLGMKILDLTFDHEAPYLSNMRRRTSRKDSDLNGVVDVRYTGGARMLLTLEVGGGQWRLQVPVLVSDLDIECRLWVKIRLAPLSPYLGTISLAFVAPPSIKVQLSPYNSVRLMRVPVLQNFLKKFLTEDLPGLMVLPKRLEVDIPPAVTAVAEAAVGRDAVMRAVASAVLQADVVEQSLTSALPLGPQGAAGGISVPDSFQGELSVTLVEGRNLPVWGFPWQSNPYCRLTLGKQAVTSKRESDTSCDGTHRNPIWNQEFEFLVEDTERQVLEIFIKDSHITGRPEVGKVEFPLRRGVSDKTLNVWLPVQSVNPGQSASGELRLEFTYKPFFDDDEYLGLQEGESYSRDRNDITDVKSAAAASSKAAVAASAAFAAVAMTQAAAARAAHKAQKAASTAKKIATLGSLDEDDDDDEDFEETEDFDPDTYDERDLKKRKDPEPRMTGAFSYDEDEDEDGDNDNDNGWEESKEGGKYEPAEDLEDSELESVLAAVKADLGEEIGNVIATEELTSQLQVLKAQDVSDGMDGNAARLDSWIEGSMDSSNFVDGVSSTEEDSELDTGFTSSSRGRNGTEEDESFQDGSNFDLPVVSHTDGPSAEYDVFDNFEKQPSSKKFVFHAGEDVAEVEPVEAVAVPYSTDAAADMGMSLDPETGMDASNVHDGDLLKDVATSVSALESRLEGTMEKEPPSLPYSTEAGASLRQGEQSMDASEKDLVSTIGAGQEVASDKKRKRQEDPQGRKVQWYSFLWPWARARQKEAGADVGELPTGEEQAQSEVKAPFEQSTDSSVRQLEKEKVPWWAVLASAVSFRRGQVQTGDPEQPRKRQKSQKGPQNRRKDRPGPRLVVPPVDVAAIARELIQMREEKSKSKDQILNDAKEQDTDDNDQQWIILLCFLTACSAVLLTVVAYRLDSFG